MDNPSIDLSPQLPAIPPPPSTIAAPAPVSERGGAMVAKLKGQYHQPNAGLVLHMLQELQYLLTSWQNEILELDQNIILVRQSGPIVAGWLEADAHKSDIQNPKAQNSISNIDLNLAPLEKIPEIIQQQSLDYQLCSLDEGGEIAARDCPAPEMFGISKALARHQQLRQLIDRKSDLEANIKHTLATLVHLRMEINWTSL